MTDKPKIPEQARRIIAALVKTPPMKKPTPRKKGKAGQTLYEAPFTVCVCPASTLQDC